MRIRRILVPVDFSEPSLGALRYAVALARMLQASLDVLHVVVLATQGRHGVGRWLLGSVAERVVRTADCPVLIVPPRRAR
jgi:nucleotide-binding universal stress UspA family protein